MTFPVILPFFIGTLLLVSVNFVHYGFYCDREKMPICNSTVPFTTIPPLCVYVGKNVQVIVWIGWINESQNGRSEKKELKNLFP